MATIIKAGNVASGAQITPDATGILQLNTGSGAGTAALTIGTDQSVTFAGNLTVDGNTTLGNANTDTILMTAAPSIGGAGLGMGFGFRNRIINGAMVIDQRNAGASVTPTANATYTLDRWVAYLSQSSKYSIQQSTTTATAFKNSFLVTSLSAYTVGAGEQFSIAQNIEGLNTYDLAWGTASAATVTLSFWVRSSLTGTFGGALRNSAGDRAYPFSYTISTANTFEQKTITIAGDTTGTWLTTNGVGIGVVFGIGVGSTLSGTAGAWAAGNIFSATGATSVVGTNGATFYITGVQLEKGSTATSFDYRPYGTELQLCYRYAWNYSSALSSNGSFLRYLTMRNLSTTGVAGTLILPVEMRVTPTLTTTGTASNYAVIHTGGTTACSVAPSIGGDGSSRFQVNLEAQVASGLTSGQGSQLMSNNNQTSYLLFSAEL